ncbi:hypothetical protein GUITHDRAFT_134743 [Guillardia theta CCMP2712]|uniref:Hormone-sensitive lipase n=1 Tax=Guillardia theta (strain CCMP2712) TaxID=905079 RepID=L1JST6_GUITC|nr:hypothetical protein GUITHDRAFT_134743 [Guillardia theta CCMP2712]EKX51250.1 hypothetical protein GUITHDRAFT_134743 [Guillardia theta CCMP2712]|eukprot:XP_005838230.1 hypothetical protein GUITHDRAFT_134743 [Guillardia theta CCMP2712]
MSLRVCSLQMIWADPETADHRLENTEQLEGKIALARRDPLEKEGPRTGFVDKVCRMVQAGASAVILVNNTDELIAPWKWKNDNFDAELIKVPVVCVRESAGQYFSSGNFCKIRFQHASPPFFENPASIFGAETILELLGNDAEASRVSGEETMDWVIENEDELLIEDLMPLGFNLSSSLQKDIRELKEEMEENLRFFNSSPEQTLKHYKRCCHCFMDALISLQHIDKTIMQIADLAAMHDVADSMGNGFWAQLRVVSCCLKKLRKKTAAITSERESVFFGTRIKSLLYPLESYLKILEILKELLQLTLSFNNPDAETQGGELVATTGSLRTSSSEGRTSLFFTHIPLESAIEKLSDIDLSVLYGDMHGYQYPSRLKHFLRMVLLAAASYSRSYEKHHSDHLLTQLASAYYHGVGFLMKPVKKGRRIAQQYGSADVKFVKSFWNLTELPVAKRFAAVVGANVEVSREIVIDGSRPISMRRAGAEDVFVSIAPTEEECRLFCGEGYVAPLRVKARLISFRCLQGQEVEGRSALGISWGNTKQLKPPSPFLILHFHGGGFIAQSSASHEVYLRDWAKALEAPILSVDYDLAPEHPFPVAVCQAFFAYCWALAHASTLGSTAKSVICVGDSAGGNLAATVAIRALQLGIKPPAGVVMLYPALYLHLTPSPSRILAMMDPLLPLGNLQLCMDAYANRFASIYGKFSAMLHLDPSSRLSEADDPKEDAKIRKWLAILSPLIAPDEILRDFPSCAVMASELDPLLDDSIMFIRRMRNLGRVKDVKLKVAPCLPHGWLNMYFVGDKGSLSSSKEAISWMKQLLSNGLAGQHHEVEVEERRQQEGSPPPPPPPPASSPPAEAADLWVPVEDLPTPNKQPGETAEERKNMEEERSISQFH